MTVNKFLILWGKIELYLIGVLGSLALILALYVMLTRYLYPQISIDWGEEVIVYLLVWATWISASHLVGEQTHVKTDLVLINMSTTVQNWFNGMHHIVGIVFSSAMALAGVQVFWFAVQIGEQTESSLHFPLWIYYLVIPLALFSMALRYLHHLTNLLFKKGDHNS